MGSGEMDDLMNPPDNPIVERYRHDGFAGFYCHFCGNPILKVPAVIIQPFKMLSDGSEYGHGYLLHAHPGCAKARGLRAKGDEIDA